MIVAHYVERRTQKLPGKKSETVVREVRVKGKKTRKQVRVYRGEKLVSSVEKPLSQAEEKNIQNLNKKTLRNLN